MTPAARVAVPLASLLGAACATDGPGGAPGATVAGPAAAPALSGRLEVLAASSLTEAFTELGRSFEADHPGVSVGFTFAASSVLSRQIIEGSPGDVFASADETSMTEVTGAANASEPRVIARNRLAIIVEKGNPKSVTGLADLARPGLVVVVCAPEVPCGRLAAAALRRASVPATPAALEGNAKAVVSRVTLGEADAGIVYATDVIAAGNGAEGVGLGIAEGPDLEAVYPMAVTTGARNPQAAGVWVAFVLSGPGQQTLQRHGFLAP